MATATKKGRPITEAVERAAKQIENTGGAKLGSAAVEIIPHPSGAGWGVEVTRMGDKQILVERFEDLADARRQALKSLRVPSRIQQLKGLSEQVAIRSGAAEAVRKFGKDVAGSTKTLFALSALARSKGFDLSEFDVNNGALGRLTLLGATVENISSASVRAGLERDLQNFVRESRSQNFARDVERVGSFSGRRGAPADLAAFIAGERDQVLKEQRRELKVRSGTKQAKAFDEANADAADRFAARELANDLLKNRRELEKTQQRQKEAQKKAVTNLDNARRIVVLAKGFGSDSPDVKEAQDIVDSQAERLERSTDFVQNSIEANEKGLEQIQTKYPGFIFSGDFVTATPAIKFTDIKGQPGFFTLVARQGQSVFEEVEGAEPVSFKGFEGIEFAVHPTVGGGGFTITEQRTGLSIGGAGQSRADAIENAEDLLKARGKEKVLSGIETGITNSGESPRAALTRKSQGELPSKAKPLRKAKDIETSQKIQELKESQAKRREEIEARIPTGEELLKASPSRLTDLFFFPTGKAMPRTKQESNRLIESALNVAEVADKVALTTSHPSFKTIEALTNKMTNEERQSFLGLLPDNTLPFFEKFARQNLRRPKENAVARAAELGRKAFTEGRSSKPIDDPGFRALAEPFKGDSQAGINIGRAFNNAFQVAKIKGEGPRPIDTAVAEKKALIERVRPLLSSKPITDKEVAVKLKVTPRDADAALLQLLSDGAATTIKLGEFVKAKEDVKPLSGARFTIRAKQFTPAGQTSPVDGFTITSPSNGTFGTKIAVRERKTAQEIVKALKRGDSDEVSRLILSESQAQAAIAQAKSEPQSLRDLRKASNAASRLEGEAGDKVKRASVGVGEFKEPQSLEIIASLVQDRKRKNTLAEEAFDRMQDAEKQFERTGKLTKPRIKSIPVRKAQAIFETRSPRSQANDIAREASVVAPAQASTKKEKRLQQRWARNPGRPDFRGVDTPGSKRKGFRRGSKL